MLPPGVLFGLLAAVCWGLADFMVARTGAKVGERTVFAVAQPVGAALLFLVVLVDGGRLAPLLGVDVLLVGLIGAVAILALYTALRMGPVAIASPIGATYGGVAAALAIIVGGEELGILAILGAVGITMGVVFVSADPRAVRTALETRDSIRPVVAIASLAAIGIGVSNFLLDGVAAAVGPLGAILGVRVVGSLVGVPFWGSVRSVPQSTYGSLLAIGVLDTGAFLAYAFGIQIARVSVVTPLASLFALVTVILGRLLLHEQLTRIQWIGVACVIIGTPLLSG